MTDLHAKMTATLRAFYLIKYHIREGAGGFLDSLGWARPDVDITPPADFPEPVVWEAFYWAALAVSAKRFAATRPEEQAKEAALILNLISRSQQAIATEPYTAFHACEAAFCMSLALATHVQTYGPISPRALARARSGLSKGPAAKAQKAEMWVSRLRTFLKEFYGDPVRSRLPHAAVWDAFVQANPGLNAQVQAMGRSWPSRPTALKRVGILKREIIA
jgi:hypothetical protein